MAHEGWGPQWTGAGTAGAKGTTSTSSETDTSDDARSRSGGGGRGSVHHARGGRRRRSSTLRRVLVGVAVVVLVVVLWLAWLVFDAFRAREALLDAADLVSGLQEEVVAGDRDAALATLDELQDRSGTAHGATHGPHWSVAGVLPWVGPNVEAVQVVSEVVDALATDALPALLDATELVDPTAFVLDGGRIDLEPLQDAAPAVIGADRTVQDSARRLAAVDTTDVVSELTGPLAELESQVRDVGRTTATAAKAVQVLPSMLGAEEPRQYLLLVQNNAEPRATGGIPGSVVLLSADDGAVEVVEQRSGQSLGDLPEPVLELSDGEAALFGPKLVSDMRDVNFTPDFPRSGEIARAIWEQQVGTEIDGVLSVDPTALGLVLGATGPVPLPPGPVAQAAGSVLSAENAAEVLLNTVYMTVEDPVAQDEFFAATAASVFAAFVGGQGAPAEALDAMAEAARQGRLMVWSAHEEEQAVIEGTVLSGELTGLDGDSPVVGVYLNDGSAAKMGFYLSSSVVVEGDTCQADGSRFITVAVTLTNTAPADAALLPPYLTGGGAVVPPGDIRTNVLLYAPEGGLVQDVRVTSGQPGVNSQVHDGLSVVGRTTQLAPGESVTLTYDVSMADGHTGPVEVRSTPLAVSQIQTTVESEGCS
ncbi:DUF4012 domain-containing protein [Sanguibacter suaedae]|uniref:DUF4012 domain-containing protein n=1 Tax=Sanguibacter suaedae TaxID=2795737 RepID=A0A934IAQ6_9MICO|nr:DUF4012 domain-containing protein [Sanguibacter suaedae]MBI9116192.1 DUF4012 domain-containing protein [Sanguibacter suaedae]